VLCPIKCVVASYLLRSSNTEAKYNKVRIWSKKRHLPLRITSIRTVCIRIQKLTYCQTIGGFGAWNYLVSRPFQFRELLKYLTSADARKHLAASPVELPKLVSDPQWVDGIAAICRCALDCAADHDLADIDAVGF
jgi:hypothetical protein